MACNQQSNEIHGNSSVTDDGSDERRERERGVGFVQDPEAGIAFGGGGGGVEGGGYGTSPR